MKSIKNDIKEKDQKDDDSLFIEEIQSLTHKENGTHGPLIEAIQDMLFVTTLGFIFYKIGLSLFFSEEYISSHSGLFIFVIVFICVIIFCNLYFSERLISTRTYEVFDIIIEPQTLISNNTVYFSYTDINKKLEKDKLTADQLLRKLYISNNEKPYVVIENFGSEGRIQRKVITQFICNKKQYEKFKESFSWDKKLT